MLVLLCCMNAMSQDSQRVYCELLGYQKFLSSKVIVSVDFGQETSFWTGTSKQYLVDKNGKAISFNSMVDAMNYMGRIGWKFEQAYVVTTSNQNVYHWLLSKDVSANEKSSTGFITKEQFQDTGAETNNNLLGEIDGIKCWVLEKTDNGLRIYTEKELNADQLKKVHKTLSLDAKLLLQFNLPNNPEKNKAYAGISEGYIIIYATNEFIPIDNEE